MRGRLIILVVAMALAFAGLIVPASATMTAPKKCGPGTTNPYCEKPPPCRDHKCQGLAGSQAVSYSTKT